MSKRYPRGDQTLPGVKVPGHNAEDSTRPDRIQRSNSNSSRKIRSSCSRSGNQLQHRPAVRSADRAAAAATRQQHTAGHVGQLISCSKAQQHAQQPPAAGQQLSSNAAEKIRPHVKRDSSGDPTGGEPGDGWSGQLLDQVIILSKLRKISANRAK